MRLSRRSALALRLAVGVGLAFIYIPLVVIVIYAFNSSNLLEWPPPGLTLDWFPKAIEEEFAREAFVTSLKAGAVATAIAIVLGTLASLAVARHRFFGRETISFLVILPIALPGIITGVAFSNTFTQVLGIDLSLFTVIVGHATFCIVVVYNNVVARLRRVSPSFEEASADLGAHTWQTFRFVTLPSLKTALARGRPARLRPLLRRDHRHQLHDRRRRRNAADLDLPQPLPAQPAAAGQRRRRDRDRDLDHPRLPRPPPHPRRGRRRRRPRRPGKGNGGKSDGGESHRDSARLGALGRHSTRAELRPRVAALH